MRVVVVGGSVAGLAAAMLLARQGHDVLVLEKDDITVAPDLDAAARSVWRPGAPHAPHGHVWPALVVRVLRQRLPDVYAALLANGVIELGIAQRMPQAIADRSPVAGDDELSVMRMRRSTFDWVLRRSAAAEPRVTLRQRVAVIGVDLRRDSLPRVRGVRTASDGVIAADLVIDASGRRSALPRWLAEAGAPQPRTASTDSGIVYYTRHYRVREGAVVAWSPLEPEIAFANIVRFRGDNGTLQLSIVALSDDAALKAVRNARAFDAVARTVPVIAAWLDPTEPISEVYAMGALQNTLRRLVVDGAPVALGVHAIGDALSATTPTFARGVALALSYAALLADVVAECGSDLLAQALAMEEAIARQQAWYEELVARDNARVAAFRHAVFGTPPPAPTAQTDGRLTLRELDAASSVDGVVWRALARRNLMLQEPSAIFEDPLVNERARAALAAGATPPSVEGLTHADALEAIARANASTN